MDGRGPTNNQLKILIQFIESKPMGFVSIHSNEFKGRGCDSRVMLNQTRDLQKTWTSADSYED